MEVSKPKNFLKVSEKLLLSAILNKNLLISVDDAKELITKSVDLGAVEGMSGDSIYAVDGRNLEEDSICLIQLHEYLERS